MKNKTEALRQREQKKKIATTFLSLECKEANDNWLRRPKKTRKAKKSNPMYVTESAKDSCIGCTSTPRVMAKVALRIGSLDGSSFIEQLVACHTPPETGLWPSSNPGTQQGEF